MLTPKFIHQALEEWTRELSAEKVKDYDLSFEINYLGGVLIKRSLKNTNNSFEAVGAYTADDARDILANAAYYVSHTNGGLLVSNTPPRYIDYNTKLLDGMPTTKSRAIELILWGAQQPMLSLDDAQAKANEIC